MRRRSVLLGLASLGTGLLAGVSAAIGEEAAWRDGLPKTGSGPLLVVFVGNDPIDADRFDAWLERRADGVQLFTGYANWVDWSGSIGWLVDRWKPSGRRAFWSIPLIPTGATLAEAAQGEHDERYAVAARRLAASQPQGPILIRTGWEFNAEWFPWSALKEPDKFAGAYRRFVRSFRSISSRFVFEWTPNIGDRGLDPEVAYPGDDYVDIIGLDFYYHPQWNSADPDIAWTHMLEQPYGLKWHQRFAGDRRKPTSYAEWGVALDSSGPYVRQAAAWFRDHDTVYQSYWNSDAAFAGKLSDNRIPRAGAAYREMFAASARSP
ncbi:hypothetical protein GCM10007874_02240 [Labrys miyagiensis]|uniref:GH26 domain-containing protein n=1 Tax=Labrys miyagiensis TaxID=346912 RepID=A0ABQ6CBN1_9HYPH|nr:glycosyl hydrolase [Labrys miyagiensis]GLS17209.1 hypothetical protein GCM10007874_02240 [Labrys miyagiensis]